MSETDEVGMIERVARALCKAERRDPDETIAQGGDWPRPNWNTFVHPARAAIEAMRQPTPKMVDAGYAVFEEAYDPAHCFSMMIDTSLNEELAGWTWPKSQAHD